MDELLQLRKAAHHLDPVVFQVLHDAVQVRRGLVVHVLPHLLKYQPVVLFLLVLLLELLDLALDEKGALLRLVEADNGKADQREPKLVCAQSLLYLGRNGVVKVLASQAVYLKSLLVDLPITAWLDV